MGFKKLVGDAELIPKGYGVAYLRYDMLAAVCYPIPFNLIVGFWHRLILGIKLFWRNDPFAKFIADAEDRGYLQGFEYGRKSMVDEILMHWNEAYQCGYEDGERHANIRN